MSFAAEAQRKATGTNNHNQIKEPKSNKSQGGEAELPNAVGRPVGHHRAYSLSGSGGMPRRVQHFYEHVELAKSG